MTENQWAAYQTAKSTRPAWANALIVAGVLVVAAVVMTLMSGFAVGAWFFLAAGVTGVIAGVLALAGVTRRGA